VTTKLRSRAVASALRAIGRRVPAAPGPPTVTRASAGAATCGVYMADAQGAAIRSVPNHRPSRNSTASPVARSTRLPSPWELPIQRWVGVPPTVSSQSSPSATSACSTASAVR
jgi:hypothetical protein